VRRTVARQVRFQACRCPVSKMRNLASLSGSGEIAHMRNSEKVSELVQCHDAIHSKNVRTYCNPREEPKKAPQLPGAKSSRG
jgi:hypothetical protein